MKFRSLKRWSGLLLSLVVAAILAGYAGLAWMRHASIQNMCIVAGVTGGADRMEALVTYLNSDMTPLEEKGRVIWVLGELRDDRALPALEALLRDEECRHQEFVCQRELRKAISKINGDTPNPYFWAIAGL